MKTYDAVVLGAGIAGLSVARELAKLKKRVLVLDPDKVGGNASRAAAGTLDPYTEATEETALFRLGLKALDTYSAFLDELGSSARLEAEYEKLGILYLATAPEDESLLKARFEWQKKRGLPVQFLSGGEVRKLEPSATPRALAGVFYPEIPKLNPEKLTHLIFKSAQRAGVEIRTSVKGEVVWKDEKRVRGVQFAGEKVESPVVVAARGSWSGLSEDLGFKLKVSPVRGQILILRSKPNHHPRHVLHSMRYAYVIPWPEGRLLVGSTLESAGFEPRVTEAGKEDILNRVSEIFEGVRALPIEKSWAGLRPFAEGGMPVIGPTRIQGLFLATGYYRSGILLGPFAGRLLAEGIVSGKFSPLLEPFFPKG